MPPRYADREPENRPELWKIVVPVGIVVLLLAIAVLPKNKRDRDIPAVQKPDEEPDKPGKIKAWVAAQEFVNEQLKSPATADYGWQNPEEIVEDQGGGKFHIAAWVDSENAFGANLRTKFVCDLTYLGRDRWRMDRLDFIEN